MRQQKKKAELVPAKKRGADRRKNHSQLTFPLRLPRGEIILCDRRVNADRRRNAFISGQELCRGLEYEKIESVLERCPVLDLDAGDVLLQPGEANHNLYLLDVSTGDLEYVNAGHNPPLAALGRRPFQYLDMESCLIAGVLGRGAHDVVEELRSDVEKFTGPGRLKDDITILAVGLRGG